MKNSKLFYGVAILAVLSMLLSACALNNRNPGAIEPTPGLTEAPATEPAATEPATEPAATEPAAEGGAMGDSIRGRCARAMIDTMTKVADAYEQANPGVTIDVEESQRVARSAR